MHEEVLSGINTRGATIYPQQIGQACSFNTELAELKTQQTATILRKMGGVLSLSPMVDVCRTPSFNRLEESYGEDAYLSAAMGVAFVKGLQQGDLKKGVGACSKHYLGYGGGGDADEKELMEEILMPHETMIRVAGSRALMPGYHAMPNTEIYEPMCYNNPSPRKVHPTLNAAGPLFATPNTQWPFGYGLSYTNFEYSNLRLACPQQLSNDSFITLSFDVKNTGKMMADEIAQIYISPTDDNQEIRRIQLQGFARVSLKPGETKKVEVKLFTEQFGFYKNVNGNHSWNVKPGTYAIKIGASSVDFRLEEQITLTGKPVHKPLREFYFSETSLK